MGLVIVSDLRKRGGAVKGATGLVLVVVGAVVGAMIGGTVWAPGESIHLAFQSEGCRRPISQVDSSLVNCWPSWFQMMTFQWQTSPEKRGRPVYSMLMLWSLLT